MAMDRSSAAVDPVADLRDSEVDSLVQRVAQSLVVRRVWSAKDELTTATTSNTSGRFIVGGCYHEVLEVQVVDVEDAEVRVDVDVEVGVDVDAGSSQQDEAANGPLPVTRTLGTDMSTMTWRVDRQGDCLLVAKQDNTARVARLEPDGEIVQTQSLTLGSPQHYVRGAPVLLTAPDGLKYPLAFMVGGWDSQATFYCADGPFSYRKAFEVHLGGTMSTGDWCRPAHAPGKLWFVVNVSSTAVVYEYDMESHTHDEVFRVGTNINGHGLVLTPEFVMVKASESVYVYSLRTRALEAVLPVDRYAESFRRVSQCSLGSPSSSYHMTMLGDTSVLLVSLSRVLMAVDVRTGAPLAFAPWKHSGSQAPYDVQVDGDAGLLYSVSTDRSHACYVYDVSPLLFHRNHQLAFVLGLNDPRTAVHRFGHASMFDRNLVKLVFSFVSSRLKFNST